MSLHPNRPIHSRFWFPTRASTRLLVLALLGGVLVGAAASLFLYGLNFVTVYREMHPWVVVYLPLAGLVIALIYQRFGSHLGLRTVLEQSSQAKGPVPFRLAPMILTTTWLTHLFGGSAGREGTAVQMGGTLQDWLGRRLVKDMDPLGRRKLLVAGLGAGFGAAIGAPLAGWVFSLEVLRRRGFRWFAYREAFVASFAAYYTSQLLRTPHTHFPEVAAASFTPLAFAAAIALGCAFGCTARAFVWLTHFWQSFCARIIPFLWRPVLGGILLLVFYGALGHLRFAGLSLEGVQDALAGKGTFTDFLGKGMATVITLGAGFKGGEFVPLVFLGSTLGAVLGPIFLFPASGSAALGFGAVFGAAAQTPVACAVMTAELFGWSHFPLALCAGGVAYFCSGPSSIYAGQGRGAWPWRTRIV